MRIVDQNGEQFARAVKREGLVDQLALDLEVAAREVDFEGLAGQARSRQVMSFERASGR
ncbi:MAG: hypothetical protein ACHQ5A_12295 [Opitutales bacterium]